MSGDINKLSIQTPVPEAEIVEEVLDADSSDLTEHLLEEVDGDAFEGLFGLEGLTIDWLVLKCLTKNKYKLNIHINKCNNVIYITIPYYLYITFK